MLVIYGIIYSNISLYPIRPSLVAQTVKETACSAGDPGLIPRSGRFPGEGNSNPLQYSCLGNPKYRGAWKALGHETSKESDMT